VRVGRAGAPGCSGGRWVSEASKKKGIVGAKKRAHEKEVARARRRWREASASEGGCSGAPLLSPASAKRAREEEVAPLLPPAFTKDEVARALRYSPPAQKKEVAPLLLSAFARPKEGLRRCR
jgi:hypothetical protein